MSKHGSPSEAKILRDVPYSQLSSLNTLDICIPAHNGSNPMSKVWIIYIHGGAWRDPEITARSFTATQNLLLASRSASQHIAGLASLNYRLSPHPQHPAQPDDSARNASHPDHITDVLAALAYLQTNYSIGADYVLAGHSAGATLAFQTVMQRSWSSNDAASGTTTTAAAAAAAAKQLRPPRALVGIEGIYDIPALVEYHAQIPVYAEIATGAFGADRAVWRDASPVNGAYAHLSSSLGPSTGSGRVVVVLAHSRADELVEWEQVEAMRQVLVGQGWKTTDGGGGGEGELVVLQLEGKHDHVWEEGHELTKAILVALANVIGTRL